MEVVGLEPGLEDGWGWVGGGDKRVFLAGRSKGSSLLLHVGLKREELKKCRLPGTAIF